MTQEKELEEATRARAIVESLIPEQLRDPDWKARWDGLEATIAIGLDDAGLRDLYVQLDQEAGERGQDIVATACMIRQIDI